MVIWDPLVILESLVSLACLDFQDRRVDPALQVRWAGRGHQVFPGPLVMVDPLVSLDLMESKVSPVRSAVPATPAASVAATASATL